jgi:hypothetical protein
MPKRGYPAVYVEFFLDIVIPANQLTLLAMERYISRQ